MLSGSPRCSSKVLTVDRERHSSSNEKPCSRASSASDTAAGTSSILTKIGSDKIASGGSRLFAKALLQAQFES